MRALAALLLLGGLTACATYDERIETAHRAYYGGDLDGAIEILRETVAEDDADRDVAELELAAVLQTAGRYLESTVLLEEADWQYEVRDYTSMPLRDMATYVLGGEIRDYMASPPERVLVNTLNMLNYLGLGDPQEAAVEARRLSVLLDRTDVPEDELYANRFAWSLAGLTFEMARDHQEAAEAWRTAEDSPLADRSLSAGQLQPGQRPGTVLVVVQRGKVPVRRESVYYFPFGGSVHSLRVPQLVSRGSPFRLATVSVDGQPLGAVPMLFDLGAHVRLRFQRELPRLLAAAMSQAIPRAVLTETLRKSAVEAADDDHKALVEGLAFIASFLLDVGLASVTTTDTRCWSMLPAAFHARRLNLPPGPHTVTVRLQGSRALSLPFQVDVSPGRLTYLNVTTAIHEGFQELPPARSRDLTDRPEAFKALELLEAASWWRAAITD